MARKDEGRGVCELAVEARHGCGGAEGARKVREGMGCGGGGGGATVGMEGKTAASNLHVAHLKLTWRPLIGPKKPRGTKRTVCECPRGKRRCHLRIVFTLSREDLLGLRI